MKGKLMPINCGRLELDPVNTGLFLNGLAALGLLNKEQSIFSNTLMAEAFLISGRPSYLGKSFLMQREMKDMTGVLFDRKSSMDAARRFIAEYGMQARVTVCPGDYNTDAIGQGYDFIWAGSTLNFARPDLGSVMAKIYHALNPGGVFINCSEGLTHESTCPEFFVISTMAWAMHNSPFKPFDQGIVADAMLATGFRSVRSRTLENC